MGHVYRGLIIEDGQGVHCVITVDGEEIPIQRSRRLVDHSSEFQWGYGGSGPAQTAFAILLEEFGEDIALQYYQLFKVEVIAMLEMGAPWTLVSDQIRTWLHNIECTSGG